MSRSAGLWIAAALATVAAAAWQWRTGPSYPYRARQMLGGTEIRIVLPRSHVTTSPARVAVALPAGAEGTLYWRRFQVEQAFAAIPLRPDSGTFAAPIPIQPRATRVEYYLQLTAGMYRLRIPPRTPATVMLRYRDPIPALLLIAHIAVMILAMLLGVRAALAAAWEADGYRGLAILALAALTLGGFVLGPIVQKEGMGAYWTGVPFGWDLTDNKTLVAWIGWAAAALATTRGWRRARWIVAAALVIMLAAFLIPHSVPGG